MSKDYKYSIGRYGFRDAHGHPLENCVEYIALLAELAEAQSPWIDVNERLPERQGLYLVYCNNGHVTTCPKMMGHPWEVSMRVASEGVAIFPEIHTPPANNASIEFYAGKVGEITHWMPIPSI